MRIIPKHQYGNKKGIVTVSDNAKTNAKKEAELAYQNRTRTKLQFLKETADKKAEGAIKEREARRKDPEYDEKKRRVKVAEQLKQNDDGKYTSKKNTFVGRFADNLYHNSGASHYVDRAKELAKEGATPLEQATNAGLGLIGTTIGSVVGGVDAIGKGLGSNANVGTAATGLLAETPIGSVPMTLIDAGKQLGGSRGENIAELLATVTPGIRRGGTGRITSAGRAITTSREASHNIPPMPVRLESGQTRVPTVYINPITGEPSYRWATPNPNRSSWQHVGANLFDEPMSQAEIAEAVQNRTLRRAFQNGNVGDVWRNIDHNGGVHVQMRQGPNGGRFSTGTIYLPDGYRVTVDPSIAREYLNGTRRYPGLLTDAQAQNFASAMGGRSAVFDGYGINGPRYRVNFENGRPSVTYRYPEITNRITINPSLKEFMRGWNGDELTGKWTYLEKYARNPELVKSIREKIESGQDASSILSKLSNKQIDYLAEQKMFNKPRHTGNLVGIVDSNGPRPFSVQEVEESVRNDWNNRKHGSVFDFGNTNSYSYQSHLKALLTAIKKIEAGEARLLRPGTEKIYPNSYAAIKVSLPTGQVKTYFGNGIGRAGGAMDLSKLNKHYKFAYNKLNELGRKQYGDQWADLNWKDITPEQIERQYTFGESPRYHDDIRALIYKNGGKTKKLYDRRLVSKIKGV